MLFRKVVVEYDQVAPIVDRRRAVFGNDLRAQRLAFASLVRRHDDDRMTCGGSRTYQCQRLLSRKIAQRHAQVGISTVQRPSGTVAMDGEILQLHGTTMRNASTAQRLVERAVALQQRMAHEDLADDGIDVRRMDSMAPEITGPCKPVAEVGHSARQV